MRAQKHALTRGLLWLVARCQDDNTVLVWKLDESRAICGAPAGPDQTLCVKWLNQRNDRFITGGYFSLRVWQVRFRHPSFPNSTTCNPPHTYCAPGLSLHPLAFSSHHLSLSPASSPPCCLGPCGGGAGGRVVPPHALHGGQDGHPAPHDPVRRHLARRQVRLLRHQDR